MIDPEGLEIGIVQYHRLDDHTVLPFAAYSFREMGHNWMAATWDLDWCRRDGIVYYHLSGFGGRFSGEYMRDCEVWCRARFPIAWPRTTTRHTAPLTLFGTNENNCCARRNFDHSSVLVGQ
jgi:hypothetical protein